jgi:hypothetical protein
VSSHPPSITRLMPLTPRFANRNSTAPTTSSVVASRPPGVRFSMLTMASFLIFPRRAVRNDARVDGVEAHGRELDGQCALERGTVAAIEPVERYVKVELLLVAQPEAVQHFVAERRRAIAVDLGARHLHDVQVTRVLAGLLVALEDGEAVQAALLDLLPAVLGGLAELGAALEPMNPQGHAL